MNTNQLMTFVSWVNLKKLKKSHSLHKVKNVLLFLADPASGDVSDDDNDDAGSNFSDDEMSDFDDDDDDVMPTSSGARKRKGGASAAIGEYVAMKKPAEQNESGEVSKKLVTAYASYYVLHIFWLFIFSSRCVRILCVDWLS